MQVCHITSVHPRYDIRIFVKECKSLAPCHQVSLIVADSLGDEIIDQINIYDVGKISGGRLKRMRQTAQAIYTKILMLRPDVVHFHDPELIRIGCKLAKAGYKVIYDVHEDVPKQVMNKEWIPKLIRPIIAALVVQQERNAARHFAEIICATEIIASRFRRYNPNTCVIHNFPILAELNQSAINWQLRQDKLCYLGSISATRGIIPLIDSLTISGLTLELAGPYSNPQIETQIKESLGFPRVNYRGVLNRESVIELLKTVKFGIVTLLPTPSYLESLPIKLFEYMLSGIPVIASNFSLWQPIIAGHNCGLMVNPEDPQEIANACLWLLEHPIEAQQMGENGRKAVLEHYTWESEQINLLKIYANL